MDNGTNDQSKFAWNHGKRKFFGYKGGENYHNGQIYVDIDNGEGWRALKHQANQYKGKQHIKLKIQFIIRKEQEEEAHALLRQFNRYCAKRGIFLGKEQVETSLATRSNG